MVHVYCHPVVKQVIELHTPLLSIYPGNLRVSEVIRNQADTLAANYADANAAACIQLKNWLPECAGLEDSAVFSMGLSIHHMRMAVAREHGFESWEDAEERGREMLDGRFEAAVDAVLSGNMNRLTTLLEESPEMVSQRSQYGHRATLLIYLAANGVETWRQVVPRNAVQVASFLLAQGASLGDKVKVYGGKHSVMELLISSAHPRAAGVLDELIALFKESR